MGTLSMRSNATHLKQASSRPRSLSSTSNGRITCSRTFSKYPYKQCQCRRYIRKGGSPFRGYICSARMYPLQQCPNWYAKRRRGHIRHLHPIKDDVSNLDIRSGAAGFELPACEACDPRATTSP